MDYGEQPLPDALPEELGAEPLPEDGGDIPPVINADGEAGGMFVSLVHHNKGGIKLSESCCNVSMQQVWMAETCMFKHCFTHLCSR
jgi:hypothetical protein